MSWTYPAGTAEVEGWKLIKASTRALAELAKPNKKSAANVSNEDLPRWTLHLMEAGYGDSRRAILLQKHKNNNECVRRILPRKKSNPFSSPRAAQRTVLRHRARFFPQNGDREMHPGTVGNDHVQSAFQALI